MKFRGRRETGQALQHEAGRAGLEDVVNSPLASGISASGQREWSDLN